MQYNRSGFQGWPPYPSSTPPETSWSRTPSPDLGTMARYYRTTSPPMASRTGHAKKEKNHPPRPSNAFIYFRSEFSRLHAGASRKGVKPPTQSLSKQAALAWAGYTSAQRERYFKMAEVGRIEHAKKYPDYRYQPRRRTKKPRQAGTKPRGRHELVKTLMLKPRMKEDTESLSSDSEWTSDCKSSSSPASLDFSSPSPERPAKPFRDTSPASPAQVEGRSSSMPSEPSATLHDQFERSLTLSGYSGASETQQFSSDSFGMEPEPYSAAPSQYTEVNPVAWRVEPPDAEFNLWRGTGLTQYPPASSGQSDLCTFANGSFDYWSQGVMTSPPVHRPATASDVASSVATAASPLLKRRRAATMYDTVPSPLSVESSSLASWNNAPSPTAPIAGANFMVGTPPTPPMPSMPPMPPQGYVLPSPHESSVMQPWLGEQSFSWEVQGGVVDYDRTPRSSTFSESVHAQFLAQSAEMAGLPLDTIGVGYAGQGAKYFNDPTGPYQNAQADFQSYTMGMQGLGVPAGGYGVSQYSDTDLSEFVNFDGSHQN